MSDSDIPLFNADKDYYAILGVNTNDDIAVIKKAHIKLALQNHPDTASYRASGSDASLEELKVRSTSEGDDSKFREISDAWAVLSKPELRKSYDAHRAHVAAVKHTTYNYTAGTGGPSEIPLGSYSAQKNNYTGAVRAAAGFKVADKYKTEKWQNLSLAEKKASRVRNVHSPAGGGAMILIGAAIVFGGGFLAYSSAMNNKRRR